jgi:hypothetical protein
MGTPNTTRMMIHSNGPGIPMAGNVIATSYDAGLAWRK